MEITRVAVLGHSFATRLDSFLKAEGRRGRQPFNFGVHSKVEFFAFSGLKLASVRQYRGRLQGFRPQVVRVLLGGNDITVNTVPEDFVQYFLSIMSLIARWVPEAKIVVSPLMPRFYTPDYHYFVPGYNDIVQSVNILLGSSQLPSRNMKLWFHRFISDRNGEFKDCKAFFSGVGVHLNFEGQNRLAKSLFKACLFCRY